MSSASSSSTTVERRRSIADQNEAGRFVIPWTTTIQQSAAATMRATAAARRAASSRTAARLTPFPKLTVGSFAVALDVLCVCVCVSSGVDVLRNPRYNKGLAFTLAERKALKIEGLLPPFVIGQDLQVLRVLEQFRKLTTDLGKVRSFTRGACTPESRGKKREANTLLSARSDDRRCLFSSVCSTNS